MKKPVVHFEIGCSNIPATTAFYQKVFDWNITQTGETSAAISSEGSGSIPGHFTRLAPDEPQKYVTVYIETNALKEDLDAIESNGGKVLIGPIELPDQRSFAWFEDVAGNTIGLITPSKE